MGRKKKEETLPVETIEETPTEEIVNNEELSNNSNDNNEDLYAPLGDKTFTKNKNINEDLYAPFGDKTFNKDELLDSNTSNKEPEVKDSEPSVEDFSFDNIDLSKIKNDNEYLGHLDDSIIKENLKQKKTDEEQDKFDLELMKTYMGENYSQFINSKFNMKAFMFGGLYLIYRKLYLYGISMYVLGLILLTLFISNKIIIGIIISLVVLFLLHLLFGKKFNKLYINNTYDQIKKIETIYNANRDEYVLSKCKQIGGTTIKNTILIALILGVIIVFGIIKLNNFI